MCARTASAKTEGFEPDNAIQQTGTHEVAAEKDARRGVLFGGSKLKRYFF
jgi:hypothetical protein